MKVSPCAGKPAEASMLVNVPRLVTGYYTEAPDPGLLGLKRIPFEKALRAPTTHRHDYLNAYFADLTNVLDMDPIRGANISMGVDPLGSAGVQYWGDCRALQADQVKP